MLIKFPNDIEAIKMISYTLIACFYAIVPNSVGFTVILMPFTVDLSSQYLIKIFLYRHIIFITKHAPFLIIYYFHLITSAFIFFYFIQIVCGFRDLWKAINWLFTLDALRVHYAVTSSCILHSASWSVPSPGSLRTESYIIYSSFIIHIH